MPDPWGRLFPREAADRLKTDVKTLSRWAKLGLIGYEVPNPQSRHRRYPVAEIEHFERGQRSGGLVLADADTSGPADG